MKYLVTISGALVMMTGLAFAQTSDSTSWTLAEFMEAYPDVTPELFDQIDVNNDGLIDPDEYLDAVAAELIAPLEG